MVQRTIAPGTICLLPLQNMTPHDTMAMGRRPGHGKDGLVFTCLCKTDGSTAETSFSMVPADLPRPANKPAIPMQNAAPLYPAPPPVRGKHAASAHIRPHVDNREFLDEDLVIGKIIGGGANGQVRLCESHIPGEKRRCFAIKTFTMMDMLTYECDVYEELARRIPDSIVPFVGRYFMTVDDFGDALEPSQRVGAEETRLAGLVMEHMPFSDLFDVLDQLQELGDGRWYIIDILNRLRAFHVWGYYHGDVKPENLMMTEDGHILFADLGETRKDEPPNWDGRVFGTPGTQAPEFRHGWAGPRRHSDIWAVGILLFDMLFGVLPFEGAEPPEIQDNITNFFQGDNWPQISPLDPYKGERLEGLEYLKRFLVPDPRKRIQWPEIRHHELLWCDREINGPLVVGNPLKSEDDIWNSRPLVY
ncbi:kinase-like domain-containing protein [Hysterangium stoloniferum]|nr:kinase-like domain-containing protein [Hysterangium stoloniferum]